MKPLVEGQYHLDWRDLDQPRLDLRRALLEAMIQRVAEGAHSHPLQNMLVNPTDPRKAREAVRLAASDLPGEWVVVSEEWQGVSREFFSARAVYIDRERDTAAIVAGELDLADFESWSDWEDTNETSIVWVSIAELAALGRLGSGIVLP